ncbi:MAG TPA: hypothetical protein VJ044_05765, partial [Candidatus Hodarchaeales archaeon]|nr:hypothetical protein [Candidatus Hodarchaeales archaeon]
HDREQRKEIGSKFFYDIATNVQESNGFIYITKLFDGKGLVHRHIEHEGVGFDFIAGNLKEFLPFRTEQPTPF